MISDPGNADATPAQGRPSLADLRRDYGAAGLAEDDLAPTWHAQLDRWTADAVAAGLPEPNAVTFATSTPEGRPSARTVLLKAYDERGLVVFTNLTSRKGREAQANPYASIVLPWVPVERQVVAVGRVELVSRSAVEEYARSRPRLSQIAAWASYQSSVLPSREVLEERMRVLEERFAGQDVPVPPFWGGLRLVPETVEFWQGRRSRMHDRLRYRDTGDGWVVERLAP